MAEIYLNGQQVQPEPGFKVVVTKQANNITAPDSIQADYTNNLMFPDTKENRALFGYADEASSETLTPYRYLDMQILDAGIELVPNGKFELQETENGFSGKGFSGNIRLFDALGKKMLSQLDLSAYNHLWNKANVAASLQNTENFSYILTDIGKGVNLTNMPFNWFYPAAYAKLIWQRIFAEAGFRYEIEEPEMFSRLLLPAPSIPRYSKEFTQARSYYGYVPTLFYEEGGQSYDRNTIIRTVPFVSTDQVPYFDSSNGNYNKGTYYYTADKAVFVDVNVKTLVFMRASMGTASGQITLYHNGANIANHKIRTTEIAGTDNRLDLAVSVSDLLLQPGDTLHAEVKLQGETTINRWGYNLYYRKKPVFNSYTTVENILNVQVKDTFPEGGEIELTNWLPDMSQKDFVKGIIKMFGWTAQTDQYENLVKFNLFNKVLRNREFAPDWTDKRDYTNRPILQYKFGDFGQQNGFIWKPDNTVTAGYGDGALLIDNETLPLEYKALEMPFAASEMVNGFLSVPVWKVKENSDPVEYTPQRIEPRLILRKETKTGFTLTDGPDINAAESWDVYFADAGQAFDLDMQRTIIAGFYDTLLAIVNQCKYMQANYLLTPLEVQEFDQTMPVFYDGHYWYVNQIEQYENGQPVTVHLYRLNEPINQI
jgi:hypothetical protein